MLLEPFDSHHIFSIAKVKFSCSIFFELGMPNYLNHLRGDSKNLEQVCRLNKVSLS